MMLAKVCKNNIKTNLPSFIINLVAFNSTIKNLALKIIKYFGKSKNIKYIVKIKMRNYKTSSKNKNILNMNFTNFNYK